MANPFDDPGASTYDFPARGGYMQFGDPQSGGDRRERRGGYMQFEGDPRGRIGYQDYDRGGNFSPDSMYDPRQRAETMRAMRRLNETEGFWVPRDRNWVNDHRSPDFVNPYQMLDDAHRTGMRYGPEFVANQYRDAIDAADAIPQRAVSQDLERNRRDMEDLKREMEGTRQRGRRGGMNDRLLEEEYEYLSRERRHLVRLQEAPEVARVNAAFAFISSGDPQMYDQGQKWLREALRNRPDFNDDYWFNFHKDRAEAMNRQRRPRTRRLEPAQQELPPARQPERPPVKQRPERPPVQQGPERPPVQQGPERPPVKQDPPADPRAESERRAREEAARKAREEADRKAQEEAARKAREEADRKAQEEAARKAREQAFDDSVIRPDKGVYNPAGPPGLGESSRGEQFDSEKEGGDGYDIDWRKIVKTIIDPQDQSTTFEYEGEIDDGTFSDTNFKAEEKWDKNGRMLQRHIKYDGGITMKFKTNTGAREVKDVTDVTTTFNEKTGSFETTIVTTSGATFKAVTDLKGNVTSFEETTGEPQDDTVGVQSANVGNFKLAGTQFHPARPMGIGNANPGWAGGDSGNGVDWRTSQAQKDAQGNVTFNYKGEIEDSLWFNLGGDTNFEGTETLDKNNNLVSSWVKYGSSVSMSFQGPNGEKKDISGITEITTTRQQNGDFQTEVKTSSGSTLFFSKPNSTVYAMR